MNPPAAPGIPAPPLKATEANEPQFKFLVAAIQDALSVIRATDGKIAALSFGLALPLSKLAAIWSVCTALLRQTEGLWHFLATLAILVFAVSWAISITAALRTLFPIDNPAEHVSGDRPSGVFYSGALFRIPLWAVFFPQRLDSTVQFHAFFDSLPTSDEGVRKELAFELMKLVYIRTIKTKRATVAYRTFCAWLIAGGGIWTTVLALQ